MRKIFIVFSALFIIGSLYGQVPGLECPTDIFCNKEDIVGPWTLPDTIPGMTSLPFPANLCPEGGQPNNILYFSFVPSAPTVTIQINGFDCHPGFTDTDLGYQWGVYASCDEVYSSNPESLICQAFYNGNEGNTGISIGSSDEFIPGQTYVLFVDGFGGSVCSFTVTVTEGMSSVANPFIVDELSHFTTSLGDVIAFGDTIEHCTNGFFTTTVHGSGNAAGYIWSIQNDNGAQENYLPSDADTLKFTFTKADSLYKVCAIATTDCDDSEQRCFYVNVISEPNDTLPDAEFCNSDLAMGVIPADWKGQVIYSPGKYYYTIKDTILGCTHDQIVTVKAKPAVIENLDTLICGMDTLFYNGDTIIENTFEKQYFYAASAMNGCDSLLNFSLKRFHYEGQLSGLICLSNNEFGLEITTDLLLPADADSLVVIWYKNHVLLSTGEANNLQIPISGPGTYSATVQVFKDGDQCMFDLEETLITDLLSAGFTINAESLCLGDTLEVMLDNYQSTANYEWQNVDEVIKLGSGNYKLVWNAPGYYNLQLKVSYGNCDLVSSVTEIYVESPLEKPVIDCAGASNDSIAISWNAVDCATEYEIWLDGIYISTETALNYSFTNLDDGVEYEIMVVAISDCLCPSTSEIILCITENCPDDVELFIDQLPLAICADEFLADTQLTGFANGTQGGIFNWVGSIITTDGLISHSGIMPGDYPIRLEYELETCLYEKTDTFTLFPAVDHELEVYDISCFYNNDGEIILTPMQGTSPFSFYLDGTLQADMEIYNLTEGDHQIILVDGHGCSKTTDITIFRPEAPQIEISGATFVERGELYNYELSIQNMDYDSVVWYIPSLDTILCQGDCDQITYTPDADTELCIEFFYDSNCSQDTCIELRVNRDVNVYVPNVFTPGNKDGINDYFMLVVSSYDPLKVITFDIYDRWGGIMFHKANTQLSNQTDETFGWDGNYNGQEAVPGVYVYYIELEDQKGNVLQFYGDVTLVR